MIDPSTLPTRRGTRAWHLPRRAAAALSAVLLVAIIGLLATAGLTATGSGAAVAGVLMPHRDPGPAPAAPPAAAARPVERPAIVIADYRYEPAELTVPAGTTITVENHAASALTVTAVDGEFDSGPVPPGGTATVTAPAAPGTYRFHCAQLPVMTGELTVT